MIYYTDNTITLHHGDALGVARTLPDQSVDCIVTSPPYFGLRDYGAEGQYGLEATPAEFVRNLRQLFSELRRVLADDGTFWLNLGDSYGRGSRPISQPAQSFEKHKDHRPQDDGRSLHLPPKNLLGIPWRTTFALQEDGWILRSSIIWHKPNPMPESIKDRVSSTHENIFMFSKSQKYWFDLNPIREPLATQSPSDPSYRANGKSTKLRKRLAVPPGANRQSLELGIERKASAGKNPGDVWTIPTQPFAGAHFATFPQELVRRAILSGCRPGGTVLDPFSGSGTTGLVAQNHGRKYVGIDISADYLQLSLETRLRNGTLDL